MISESEIEDCRNIVAKSGPMTRSKLAALRVLRAAAMDKADAIAQRAGNNGLSDNDQAAFDRLDRDVRDFEERILRGERELAQEDEDGARRNPLAAAARGSQRPAADLRGPFLARESRMAEWVQDRGLAQGDQTDPAAQRDFSMGRMVRGMITGRWDDAEAEHRALSVGASATGGVLVPTITSADVIDRLRNTAQVFTAGARTVPMGSQSVTLPRLDGGVTPGWRAQNDLVAESDPSFGGVTLDSKTLAVLTRIPVELLEDISSEASDAITAELVAALALEIDRAALYGSGTGEEPTGVKNTAGVNVENIADPDGAVPTDYSALLKARFAVRKRNAAPNAVLMAERTAETLAGFTASDGQPLRPPVALGDVAQLATNQVPTDLTTGVNNDTSDLLTGDYTKLAVGFRPEVGVRLASSADAGIDRLQHLVVAFVRADVAVLHPAAFEVTTGVRA